MFLGRLWVSSHLGASCCWVRWLERCFFAPDNASPCLLCRKRRESLNPTSFYCDLSRGGRVSLLNGPVLGRCRNKDTNRPLTTPSVFLPLHRPHNMASPPDLLKSPSSYHQICKQMAKSLAVALLLALGATSTLAQTFTESVNVPLNDTTTGCAWCVINVALNANEPRDIAAASYLYEKATMSA